MAWTFSFLQSHSIVWGNLVNLLENRSSAFTPWGYPPHEMRQ
jgi:hypothetical protein